MKIIDLRSDTVTLPTAEMRQAMFEAQVGDDVYGEDPTVNLLEAMAAEKLGKESALFTVSGTMSNLIAVITHTHHGNEVILGSAAHILQHEVAGAAAIGGVVLRAIPNDWEGRLNLEDVEKTIRVKNIHYPETTLVCIENTHNGCGGVVLSARYTKDVCILSHKHGAKVHLDGARIFNAAVALGVKAESLAEEADTVSFCISKGLSAPVGSLLCGRADFIERARKNRKMLGGGMRQAGVLAAAGIVALQTMIARLAEDHANAKRLASGLALIKGITIAQKNVQTNIVYFTIAPELSAVKFITNLTERGVKVEPEGRQSVPGSDTSHDFRKGH